MSTTFKNISQSEGGGRVAILFLLFALALYQFYHAGFSAFATICALPIFAIVVILTLKFRMFLFWTLVVVNFILQMKDSPLPSSIPMSMYNELLEILLLVLVILDIKNSKFDSLLNPMLGALIIWCSFCTLELLNDTCDMGLQVGFWYTGARLMAFQMLYCFLVFIIYINTPQHLLKYLFIWGALATFAVFWIWKQQKYGFTQIENQWIQTRGRRTHIINGGATIRYFSIFSDAASCGINLASTAVAFLLFGITAKVKKYKYIFLAIGIACTWGMFPSGTRTAVFCLLAGMAVYTVLSKSFKLTLIIGGAGLLFYIILAFTTIGSGNAFIRRMRTAFDPNDASANVRTENKQVIKKYLADAPFGIGLGLNNGDVPLGNKYEKLSQIPPDSEYVYIWVHTGIVGICVFVFTTIIMFLGACRVVMFKLTNSSLRGIGAGFCCAFVSMQLGGYANQVLMQFPNCLVFYGGLSLVFVLPMIEKEWIAQETGLLAKQEEKKRLRLEKLEKMRTKPWYSWIYKYL